jgi:hypothetical protein
MVVCLLVSHPWSSPPTSSLSYHITSAPFSAAHAHTHTTIQPFVDLGIPTGSFRNANMLAFENLNQVDYQMGTLRPSARCRWIMGVRGSDTIASKAMLCATLRLARLDGELLPTTFILDDPEDQTRFRTLYDPRKMYILKKNVQRQEGLEILPPGSGDQVMGLFGSAQSEYVVCQELLQDPLVVGGRKVNLRIYMLAVVDESGCKIYMFNDGFIYYSAKDWATQSSDVGVNVTTGYVDREVYARNPLTVQDMVRHLNAQSGVQGDHLFGSVQAAMQKLASVYAPIFMDQNRLPTLASKTMWSIFGCDLAPSQHLHIKIMEVNKGPDLGYKDARDRALKLSMVEQALDLVGCRPAKATPSAFRFIPLVG